MGTIVSVRGIRLSALKNQVLHELTKCQGSVAEVVNRLPSVSRSYVTRIKNDEWSLDVQPERSITTPENFATAILPPNIDGTKNLRDEAIKTLRTRIKDGLVEDKELVRVLSTLLKYETSLKKVVQPALNVFHDNRVQVGEVSMEVRQLAQQVAENLSDNELRELAGVDEPLNIIEGEVNGNDP